MHASLQSKLLSVLTSASSPAPSDSHFLAPLCTAPPRPHAPTPPRPHAPIPISSLLLLQQTPLYVDSKLPEQDEVGLGLALRYLSGNVVVEEVIPGYGAAMAQIQVVPS